MLSATTSTLNDFYQDKEFMEHSSKLVEARENAVWFPEFDFTMSMGGPLNFISPNDFPVHSAGFLSPTPGVGDRRTSTSKLEPSQRSVPRYQAIHEPSDPRTRRSGLFPVVQGNNKFGRRGKRRCLHCRHWRQKVSSPF
jgi:hypothetical protein